MSLAHPRINGARSLREVTLAKESAMIRRILLGLCGTPYTPFAIARAVELARQLEAEITGVTVVDVRRLGQIGPVPLGASESARELREFRLEVAQDDVERAAEEFSTACHKAGVPHVLRREEGDPFALMASSARYHDLMIFGLKSLFEHHVVTEPHDALIRLISSGVRPLLAVTADARPIEKILIAYSGSMESAKTMKYLAQLRLWPKAKVRVVTFSHMPDEAEQLIGDAVEYLQKHGFEPDGDYVPTSPRHDLLPYAAKWGADLIVAGNSAKNLLRRHVFGETSLHLITTSDRPLFLAQ